MFTTYGEREKAVRDDSLEEALAVAAGVIRGRGNRERLAHNVVEPTGSGHGAAIASAAASCRLDAGGAASRTEVHHGEGGDDVGLVGVRVDV